MKFNFLNLLSKDGGSKEQVAQEIVLLENKIAEAKAEEERLVKESHDLRAKQLCGEAVSASDMRGIKDKLAEVQVDQVVFSDGLDKLTAKLADIIEEQNRQDWEQWRANARVLFEEDRKFMTDLIKFNARVAVLRDLFGDCIGRGTLSEDEIKEIERAERKEYLEGLGKPNCADKASELARKEYDLKNFKVEEVMEGLLNLQRGPAIVKETALVG